jgi:hypothetical protein
VHRLSCLSRPAASVIPCSARSRIPRDRFLVVILSEVAAHFAETRPKDRGNTTSTPKSMERARTWTFLISSALPRSLHDGPQSTRTSGRDDRLGSAMYADLGRDDRLWSAKTADLGRDDRLGSAKTADLGRDDRLSVCKFVPPLPPYFA